MDIRAALAGVAGYSHLDGKQQPAQKHLESIRREPPPEIPLGLRIRVSGSGQSLPVIPWIALLDGSVTTTATEGLYLVYLFTDSRDAVYLSMNQGATRHREKVEESGAAGKQAEREAIESILQETAIIRKPIGALIDGLLPKISLGVNKFLPVAYEAGNIAALRYEMGTLPASSALAEDLRRFGQLYEACVNVTDQLAANRKLTTTSARSTDRRDKSVPLVAEFKPKDSSDYRAHVAAAVQRKTRAHEALVANFGDAVRRTGRDAFTNVHPRDLVVRDHQTIWLVEAKTVGVNALFAVREAIGQLFSYRHFYHRRNDAPDPELLGLFSAPIGPAFEDLLTSLDIHYVYRDGADWRGSIKGLNLLR
jgi:hypothetical protein